MVRKLGDEDEKIEVNQLVLQILQRGKSNYPFFYTYAECLNY